MADLAPALRKMETALRSLNQRMKLTDPRKQRTKLLLLAVANKFDRDGANSVVTQIEASASAIDGLFGAGDFRDVMSIAEATVAAV